jgi:hypothetical protein
LKKSFSKNPQKTRPKSQNNKNKIMQDESKGYDRVYLYIQLPSFF